MSPEGGAAHGQEREESARGVQVQGGRRECDQQQPSVARRSIGCSRLCAHGGEHAESGGVVRVWVFARLQSEQHRPEGRLCSRISSREPRRSTSLGHFTVMLDRGVCNSYSRTCAIILSHEASYQS